MSEHSAHDHGHHEDHADHGGVGKYIAVAVGLALLSTASFLTTSEWWHRHFTPSQGWAFMMAVSSAKALLVILFFMHLIWEANWKYVLTIPAGLMSIFLGLMLVPDIGWRTDSYSEERWEFAARPPEHQAALEAPDQAGHDDAHAAPASH